jgi:hypothetical protein
VRMAGARMFRRMRMFCLHALAEVTAYDLDPAARHERPCSCFFIHQSLADYIS